MIINIKKLSIVLASLSFFFVVGAVVVYAADPVGGGTNSSVSIELTNPFNCAGASSCTLFTLLETVISNILLPIGGVLAVMAFIYSGFLYVMAQGSDSKLKTAHQALLYTSVGTAVLLGSWVIAKVIEATINQLK